MRWRMWFSGSAAEFLRKFSSRVRGFPVLCTYIHKRGLSAPEDLERGARHVRYRKARRAGQKAGARNDTAEAAARHLWAVRCVYAAVCGDDRSGGAGDRTGRDRRAGDLRRDAAAQG